MKKIQKYIFADKAGISNSSLRRLLTKYRSSLERLGQQVSDKMLNHLSVLFLCEKEVYDPKDFYPDINVEELTDSYNIINKKLYEEVAK